MSDRDQERSRPPTEAENNAWFAFRAIAKKQGREADEISFRTGWRQGCGFTFGATSKLSPAIDAFVAWMDYVTSWSAPSKPVEQEVEDPALCPSCGYRVGQIEQRDAEIARLNEDDGPAGARMTTEQMDGADAYYTAEAEKPTQARS